jgi:Tol biopolymer transport system component
VGYRFTAHVAEVTPAAAAREADPPPVAARRRVWPAALVAAAVAVLTVGAVALSLRPSAPDDSRPASFVPVQFSSSAGLDIGASFSPDGRLIAYSSDKGGTFEIYVKSFDGAARELQLTSDGNQNFSPAFSPDGRWVAFASTRRPGIYRVPAIGGPVQRLTEFGVYPVWSPDSRTIAFRSSDSASLSTTDYYWPAESTLWIVPVNGGEPTRITGPPAAPPGGQSFPSFSRDGAEIRFLSHFRNEASIWTYRLEDGSFRKRFGSTTYSFSNPVFAPDDSRMWFVNWRLNGNIGIWQVAVDPATLAPAGEPEPMTPPQFAVPRDLALSPDGRRVAFTAALSQSSVMVQDLDGESSAAVPLTQDTTYRYGLVRSSADGTRVVVTSFPRNGVPGLMISDADGSHPVVVARPDAARLQGALTTDGRAVFYREFADGKVWVGMQRLDDGASRRLSELPVGANQISFSRDGALALFHDDRDDRRQVYLQETATGARRVIASGPEDVGYARFSRDDRWIALEITHRERGGTSIATMSASGGPYEVILESDQPVFPGGWMPDHVRILAAARREGVWNVYALSRTTGALQQLTSYTSPRTYVRYPDWLAGDRLVYEFNETKGNIFVADLAGRLAFPESQQNPEK